MLRSGRPFTDRVHRAMTDDGSFRVITAETTATVRGAVQAQRASGETARHFGDLLTAAVIFRHTMAPELRVQSILRGAEGAFSLVADSHPSGATRGLVQLSGTSEVRLGPGTLLRLMRTLQSGDVNQGVIELAEGDGVTQGLMTYMHVSEQVDTMLAVGTVMEGERVVAAGGYLVQLLPGAGRGPLLLMTERLEDFRDVHPLLTAGAFTPEALMEELLFGMSITHLGQAEVGFECWCDELRLVSALATLPRQDVEHLLEGGDPLEITCDYCGHEYRIVPAQLRGLLASS